MKYCNECIASITLITSSQISMLVSIVFLFPIIQSIMNQSIDQPSSNDWIKI